MARTKKTASNYRHQVAFKTRPLSVMPKVLHSQLTRLDIKRRYRHKPGTVALREVHKLQRTSHLLIPRSSFQYLIREIAMSYKTDLRFQREALLAIQEAAEDHLVSIFQHTQNLAIHGGRKTIQDRDLSLALHVRDNNVEPFIPPVRTRRDLLMNNVAKIVDDNSNSSGNTSPNITNTNTTVPELQSTNEVQTYVQRDDEDEDEDEDEEHDY